MSTDKYLLEGLKDGFHGTFKVTPISISAQSRTELPSGGISAQLLKRKTILVANEGSGEVYVGGENVGFGPGHGGGSSPSCSGIAVISGAVFTLDAGRSRVYAFNPNLSAVTVKLLEVS